MFEIIQKFRFFKIIFANIIIKVFIQRTKKYEKVLSFMIMN